MAEKSGRKAEKRHTKADKAEKRHTKAAGKAGKRHTKRHT
jgi:hypothetical protein